MYNSLQLITACGGNFSNLIGVLTSPSHPNAYPELVGCTYLISQPNGTYVNISFNIMDIDCQATPSDFIEMRDGNSEESPLIGRYCGNGSNIPGFIQTTQNHLRIRYKIKKHFAKTYFLPFVNSYSSDSSPTTLEVAMDFSSHMNQPVCPTGAITLVHVEAV